GGVPEGAETADAAVGIERTEIDDRDHHRLPACLDDGLEGPRRLVPADGRALDHADGYGVRPAVDVVPEGGDVVAALAGRRSNGVFEAGIVGEEGEPALPVAGAERGLVPLDRRS